MCASRLRGNLWPAGARWLWCNCWLQQIESAWLWQVCSLQINVDLTSWLLSEHKMTWMCMRVPPARLPRFGLTELTMILANTVSTYKVRITAIKKGVVWLLECCCGRIDMLRLARWWLIYAVESFDRMTMVIQHRVDSESSRHQTINIETFFPWPKLDCRFGGSESFYWMVRI